MTGAIDHRVRGMLARAIVELVNDEALAQELQVALLEDELHDGVERFQNYGFTSRPKPGAEAIFLAIGGLRSHGVVIAVEDRRFRLRELEEGEVALYDDLGNVVKLGREKLEVIGVQEVAVTAPKVVVDTDELHLGGEGGPGVARIGDAVSGGVITGGSTKVKAV